MKNPADTFFRQPDRTIDRINAIKSEIDYLFWLMMPSGIDYARDKVMTSPEDTLPEYATHKADLERELKDLQRKYLEQLKAVKIVICHLRDVNEFGAAILTEYYISHKSITRIAEDHHYSREGIYKARNKALRQSLEWI
jgi:hypothetical protein